MGEGVQSLTLGNIRSRPGVGSLEETGIMDAVIVTCLLAVVAGWLLSFLGFAILWLLGLVFFAVFLMPAGSTIWQYVISLFALGVVAQVGFFASILVQAMMGRSSKAPEQATRRSLIGRMLRQSL
jgi:K+-sensing histidine kinase KdpD